MSLNLNCDRLLVENYGSRCVVADDIMAELMYYLDCVDGLIPDFISSYKYHDYRNYNSLSKEDEEMVIKYALLLHPKILIEIGIFVLNDDLLPSDSNNTFYRITDDRIGIHVNQNMMIGGRAVNIVKVMACNNNWLNKNYYSPMEIARNSYKYSNLFRALENKNKSSDYCVCCCCCFCCIIIIVVIIVLIVKFA